MIFETTKVARFSTLAVIIISILGFGCRASPPGPVEEAVVSEAKEITIGGEDWVNPTPDTPETVQTGAEHFRHHSLVSCEMSLERGVFSHAR
ncbi:hypothetical protein BH24BAC1_BH24BAC1_39410 [soil metagenome]